MPPSTIPHSRPLIEDADLAAVAACLRSGMIAEGARASELEAALARRFGFPEAVVVGSGCQALRLALEACDAGPGTRVATPTYVCPEVLGVIEAVGAIPHLADVGEDYLLDDNDPALRDAQVVVVPALLGRSADIRRYRRPGVRLVADWAQYAPPAGNGDAADSYDLAIVSFEATKLIAAGEGGAVLVRDPAIARTLRALKTVSGAALKLNLYPLSDLQAALALCQLSRLDAFLARRAQIAALYREALGLPSAPSSSAHYRFVTRVRNADETLASFAVRGVSARRPVDPLLHHVRPQQRDFPTADRLYRETISLPCHPSLTDAEVERVIEAAGALLA